ncbi:MAG TPA: DNA methyltransferase [Roseiflexaceae bacterium]
MIATQLGRQIHTSLDFRSDSPLTLALAQDDLIPENARALLSQDEQRAFPAIAKDMNLLRQIQRTVQSLPSSHHIVLGDSRLMAEIPDASVHLVLTSPPYWTLKQYVGSDGQLGEIEDYEAFLAELDRVWQHVYRVLVPGGRLIIVVGDVCVSRKKYGRHLVFPLHSSIQEHCRALWMVLRWRSPTCSLRLVYRRRASTSRKVSPPSPAFFGRPKPMTSWS